MMDIAAIRHKRTARIGERRPPTASDEEGLPACSFTTQGAPSAIRAGSGKSEDRHRVRGRSRSRGRADKNAWPKPINAHRRRGAAHAPNHALGRLNYCPAMPVCSHAPGGEAARGAVAAGAVRLLRACAARAATAVPGAGRALAACSMSIGARRAAAAGAMSSAHLQGGARRAERALKRGGAGHRLDQRGLHLENCQEDDESDVAQH